MEWAALFNVVKSWSPSALTAFLAVVVLSLIKKIDANSKKDEERAKDLRDDINKTLNDFGTRLSTVEKEYVKMDFFLREFSGWKSEINRLSDKIDTKFESLVQHIIQILNQGKK
jgi:predicted  nucleic acid-binding Zn-ribbon protein